MRGLVRVAQVQGGGARHQRTLRRTGKRHQGERTLHYDIFDATQLFDDERGHHCGRGLHHQNVAARRGAQDKLLDLLSLRHRLLRQHPDSGVRKSSLLPFPGRPVRGCGEETDTGRARRHGADGHVALGVRHGEGRPDNLLQRRRQPVGHGQPQHALRLGRGCKGIHPGVRRPEPVDIGQGTGAEGGHRVREERRLHTQGRHELLRHLHAQAEKPAHLYGATLRREERRLPEQARHGVSGTENHLRGNDGQHPLPRNGRLRSIWR